MSRPGSIGERKQALSRGGLDLGSGGRFRVALRHIKLSSSGNEPRVENAYLVSQQYVGSISHEAQMKILMTAAMFSALALSPASAAPMACTGDNMAKSIA